MDYSAVGMAKVSFDSSFNSLDIFVWLSSLEVYCRLHSIMNIANGKKNSSE